MTSNLHTVYLKKGIVYNVYNILVNGKTYYNSSNLPFIQKIISYYESFVVEIDTDTYPSEQTQNLIVRLLIKELKNINLNK